jgi:uncharacterized membrane protein YeaQ/YmgE (transglycosylase-associated protein family)
MFMFILFLLIAVLVLKLVGSLLAFGFMLVIAALIGAAADALVPGRLPYGWLGAMAAGLLGAWLGTLLMGSIPPHIAGLAVLPSIVGAGIVAFAAQFVFKSGT